MPHVPRATPFSHTYVLLSRTTFTPLTTLLPHHSFNTSTHLTLSFILSPRPLVRTLSSPPQFHSRMFDITAHYANLHIILIPCTEIGVTDTCEKICSLLNSSVDVDACNVMCDAIGSQKFWQLFVR